MYSIVYLSASARMQSRQQQQTATWVLSKPLCCLSVCLSVCRAPTWPDRLSAPRSLRAAASSVCYVVIMSPRPLPASALAGRGWGSSALVCVSPRRPRRPSQQRPSNDSRPVSAALRKVCARVRVRAYKVLCCSIYSRFSFRFLLFSFFSCFFSFRLKSTELSRNCRCVRLLTVTITFKI